MFAFIVFVERDLPTTDEREARDKKVLDIASGDVRGLAISVGEQSVRLARQDGADGEWRIVSPIDNRADATAVRALVDRLTGLETSRTIEGVDRAAAGLDAPRATITIDTDREDPVIEIGPAIPASTDMLVARAGGEDAYQVPGDLFDLLARAPGDWRDPALFSHGRDEIARFRLASPHLDDRLLARRGDAWWLESPLVDRAADELVDTLTSQITGLRATRFVDREGDAPYDFASFGLAPVEASVEVHLAGREDPFVLELGGPASARDGDPADPAAAGREIFARAGDQVFVIGDDLVEAMDRAPYDWRSRAWTDWQVFEIQTATFRDAEGSLEIRRAGSEWLRDGEAIDYATASDALYALTEVEGEVILDRDDPTIGSLGEPMLEATLTRENGDTETLTIHPAAEDGVAWAAAAGRDALLKIPATTADTVREALVTARTAPEIEEESETGTDDAGADG